MAAEPLVRALTRMRGLLLDDQVLVRAVASGRRKGQTPPLAPGRAAVRRPQGRSPAPGHGVRRHPGAHSNHAPGDDARAAVDDLLDQPFGNWHVETTTETHQLRVTKKLEAMVHVARRGERRSTPSSRAAHDRQKPRLLPEDDPVLVALGISDQQGRVKPSRQAKYRQVEEFLRSLGAVVDEAIAAGRLRTPDRRASRCGSWTSGCGNAYLTFAAHAYLTGVRGLPVRLLGVDVQGAVAWPTTARSPRELGIDDQVDVRARRHRHAPSSRTGPTWCWRCTPATPPPTTPSPGRSRGTRPLVLAAPCCHHDIAAQLRRTPTPAPYALLTRDGILRERFADTLTDALRAAMLRLVGYRVDVIEFVDSRHTPATRCCARSARARRRRPGPAPSSTTLTTTGACTPALAELLDVTGWRGAARSGWPSSAASACVVPASRRRGSGRRPEPRRSSRSHDPAISSPAGWSTSATGASTRPTTPGDGAVRLRRRPGDRRDGRPDDVRRRGRATSRRSRPAATAPSGSATSATTAAPRQRHGLRGHRRARRGGPHGGARRYDLTYPDGPHNAETLLVDPRRTALRGDQVASSVARCTPRRARLSRGPRQRC